MSLIAQTADMVGRDAELSLLGDALRRAAAGETASVLVAGEAGIGKTRLLREFRTVAERSAAVFTGWCVDYGATPAPYAPLPSILRGVLTALGDDGAEAAGPARAALRLLIPELGPADRAAVSPDALREAIANLLEAAAERRPVVVLVEDLHWADDATLAMLSFLLRALSGHRVLFVLTCRVDEVRRGGGVRAFLVEAERARLLERVTLRRLDPVAVRAMVEALNGPTDDTGFARLLERSEGVPFFIEELSCNALGPLPESLRDLLLARFDRLGEDAKRVVRTVSGSDAPVPHELLAGVAGLPDERLDDGIREAAAASILAVRPDDSYGFRHALLREAVHDDLLPGERARLHRAYAEALEAAATADPASCLESALAYHWHQAHDAPRALSAAIAAMERAKASYAFSTAARFGELALELWDQVPSAAEAAGVDRVTLLLRLGSILRNAGDGERSLAVVDLALAEVEPKTVEPRLHARLLRDKALYLQNLGRPGSAELLCQALDRMDGVDDDRLRATLLNLLGGRRMVAAQLEEAIATADEAYRIAERIGDDAQMSVAANTRGSARVHLGDVEGGLTDFRLAWERAADDTARLRYHVNYSDILHHLGRHREAVRIAEEGIAHARTLGVERTSGSLLTQNLAEPLLQLGEVDRAEELLAKDLTFRTHRIFRVYTMATRIRLLAWRGRLDEARGLLDEWRPTMLGIAPLERQVEYSLIATELTLRLNAGDAHGAAEIVRGLVQRGGPLHAQGPRLLLESAWAVAALRAASSIAAGAETEADAGELAAGIAALWASTPPGQRPDGWGVLLTALLDGEVDALRTAVPVADADDMPAAYRVVVRLELARRLVRGDRAGRAEAASVLADAALIAAQIGHVRLAQDVDALATASGVRAEQHPSGVNELTAREAQVLELLAEGLSNRQISERLFISVKTVSVHVSAILRKLGASSRSEAAARHRARALVQS
ncbi:ATP-binding protein [Microbacterium sp.]|uniref:ATP-binding protein n=1 Tax=Microbacterium sp. TaxID=51671 RepID=UPI0028122D01|nr:AAA family ATPase [Microbacterium sp.]